MKNTQEIKEGFIIAIVTAFITYLLFWFVAQDINVLCNGNNGLSILYIAISFGAGSLNGYLK